MQKWHAYFAFFYLEGLPQQMGALPGRDCSSEDYDTGWGLLHFTDLDIRSLVSGPLKYYLPSILDQN